MRRKSDPLTAMLALLTLVITAWTPSWGGARNSGARLEGLVLDVDGRPARGYAVHLVDDEGRGVARSTSDSDGVYSFVDLESGRYSLGIEAPDGQMAPVAAPPFRLRGGELARRDVKLVQATAEGAQSAVEANYGLGVWWAGLSTPAKAWTVVGIVAIAAITVAALTDDDEPASPY